MQKEKIKVYTYTRVSTAMQVDGYSLDALESQNESLRRLITIMRSSVNMRTRESLENPLKAGRNSAR